MKKIPTMFVRNPENRSRVLNQITPGCEWVFAGEGIATRKLDGTCCLLRDGKLFKRREFKLGNAFPTDFELADSDPETGKVVGWVPVTDSPEDRWHREAHAALLTANEAEGMKPPDATYELVGPKVQGNPERCKEHQLVRHSLLVITDVPRTFDVLSEWLSLDIEGVVFHHPDGRMAKIKGKDFGVKRVADHGRELPQSDHEVAPKNSDRP